MENKLKLLKELLERFKAGREVHEPFVMSFEDEIDDALEWAIEQAERVEMLEDIIYQDERQAVLEGLYEENKRYRELLEKVDYLLEKAGEADEDIYDLVRHIRGLIYLERESE